MEKNHRGLSAKHVVVNGDDVQFMSAKRLQHRRNFGFAHGDVASNLRVGVAASKSVPGVQAHARVHGCAMLVDIKTVAAQLQFVDRTESYTFAADQVVYGDEINAWSHANGSRAGRR